MSEIESAPAWLEQPSGERVPVQDTCSIGRLPSNNLVLADERVSRRHALINVQDRHEFWLVDLGTGNGTYLNGRRLVQPALLHEGDTIEIAAFRLVFRRSAPSPIPAPRTAIPKEGRDRTLKQIKSTECWLLVVDIVNSTQLMKELSASKVPLVFGQWFEDCKRLIEECGGTINKFLGDGFLAYWPHQQGTEQQVRGAVERLLQMQPGAHTPFRFALHFGRVAMGGVASLGEESLQGKEVHFAFRMEKLAGHLNRLSLVSDTARNLLPPTLHLEEVGSHSLQGFEGEHLFHALAQLG